MPDVVSDGILCTFVCACGWLAMDTDLIWVDNLRSAGTVNYQVQKLFSNKQRTNAIPCLSNNKTAFWPGQFIQLCSDR